MNAAARTLCALSACLLGGCGPDDGHLETYPVQGQVLVNGEPAAGCTVVFLPLDPEVSNNVRPGGLTDEEGRFELATYETGDGAPALTYGVTFRWEATDWPGRAAEEAIDPVQPVGPDRFQGALSSPSKSGVEVTVEEGENVLEPFRLDDVKLLPNSK
ncbi:transthyretin-like family protein [Alienimonas californiensis]|uniref:Nickel uptake substrate-specific transmembrane region n=1 Tax=Alienimonas californiensis TaxID=2527989 RepID=A0A517PB62_9PLAN|nr:hypothetical protein [Alienimonas californiensis]QDT16614.1 hypothetical protein CA12_27200 [Alienimonas californiensis]